MTAPVVVVTGATGAIGSATARLLVDRGWRAAQPFVAVITGSSAVDTAFTSVVERMGHREASSMPSA